MTFKNAAPLAVAVAALSVSYAGAQPVSVAALSTAPADHPAARISPSERERPADPHLAPLRPAGDQGDVGSLIYLGAQTLAERAGVLSKDRPILVATMVDINDLNRSSTFGRLASQLVSNRLSQRGYMVRDITFAKALMTRPETGELVLSHEAARVSGSVNAQAVVAGTYAVGGRQIYLNLRLLKADDGEVLSSADVVLPLNHDTEAMFGPGPG